MRTILYLQLDHVGTPIGEMLVLSDCEGNLRAVDWADHQDRMYSLLRRYYGHDGFKVESASAPIGTRTALSRYFAGELSAIETLPVQTGGTAFQRDVWQALRSIRPGTTISYGQLAHQIGRPKAGRAVGLANGSNPIGIVLPCHRVIGADRSLTGYGGGIERKAWLLRHERAGH